MSQYGDGEYAETSSEEDRRARKEHPCSACGEAIRPGDTYRYVFYVYDGEPYQYRRCARCEIIFRHLEGRIRKEGDPEEYCDATLNCGHEYEERWSEPPPGHIAALAFWLPGDTLPEAR